MSLNVYDIAEWLVNKAARSQTELTSMKLQKLLYYAQGYWMALHDGAPLFPEEFRRLQYGPVCIEMLDEFPRRGSNHIAPEHCNFIGRPLDEAVVGHLEKVWRTFAQLTPYQLSKMTHEESPWLETPENKVISKRSIYAYFSGLMSGTESRGKKVGAQ